MCVVLGACSCGRTGYDALVDGSPGPDAGASFEPFEQVMMPPVGHVQALSISGAKIGRAYAVVSGGRVFRTESLGSSWVECSPVDGAIAVYTPPSAADRVYVGTASDVRRSDDACDSWTSLAQPEGGHEFFEASDGSLIVATGSGLRRFGATGWEALPGALDGVPAERIVSDTARQNLYGLATGQLDSVVAYSTDGGVTWDSSIAARPLATVRDIAIDHADPGRVYAARNDGCYVFDRDLDTWTQLLNFSCYSVATTEADPQRVVFATGDRFYASGDGAASFGFAQVPGHGIERLRFPPGSTDRVIGAGRFGWSSSQGTYATWTAQNSGMAAQVILDLEYRAGTGLVAAAGATQIAVSTGGAWTIAPPLTGYTTYTRVVADRSTERLYVGGRQLARTSDAGATLSHVWLAGEIDKYRVTSVFADGDVVVAGTGGRLAVSENGGAGWVGRGVGGGEPEVFDLVQDAGGTLWLGTSAGVLYTDDLGTTTTAVSQGLASLEVRRLAQTTDGTLLAATGDGLHSLAPGDDTWQLVPSLEQVRFWDVVVRDDVVAAVTSDSVFVSSDGGASWTPLTGFDGGARSVAIDDDGGILVGTYGYGLFRAAPAPQ